VTVLAFVDLALLLRQAGFPFGTAMQTGVAVVAAESGRDPAAVNTNPDGSRDRGLWQINDRAHPEVSDECAFDPACSTKEALRISNQGADYSPWTAFQNGSYRQHLEAAAVALDGAARVAHRDQVIASLQDKIRRAVADLS